MVEPQPGYDCDLRRLVVFVALLAVLALGCGIALGATLTTQTATQTTGNETTTTIPKTTSSTTIVAMPQYQLPAYARPIERPPGDAVRRAMAHGPNHSTFAVWTYRSGPALCFTLTVATPRHARQSLGGGCQVDSLPGVVSMGG